MKTRIAIPFKRVFQSKPRSEAAARYLVHYDGSLESMLALRQACETARDGTRVVAVYLDAFPHGEPLPENKSERSMKAKAILAAALANARVWNVSIDTLCIPCHVAGPAFIALSQTYGNATLFVGVDKKTFPDQPNPFADFVLACAQKQVVLVET